MGKNSNIEWTDHTWNPWVGCRKVSLGCAKCYMFRDMERFGQNPRIIRRTSDKTFYSPKSWDAGRVFTCSWSDFFISDADPFRPAAWGVIKECPNLTFLILTKRIENVLPRLPEDWGGGWDNVWLGVSCEDQKTADQRIPVLMGIPAKIRFLSLEPLLGDINLYPYISQHFFKDYIHWVIDGGESGAGDNFRPAKLDWFRGIRDQCIAEGIPYFHKQHGGGKKIDGAWGGRVLDGRVWDEVPEPIKDKHHV